MLIWMKHPDHGVTEVYDNPTVKHNKRNGWEVMTKEEVNEMLKPKAPKEPVDEVTRLREEIDQLKAQLTTPDVEKEVKVFDPQVILDQSIKHIIPSLPDYSNQELKELLETEVNDRDRTTLVKELEEEIDERGDGE